MNFLNLLSVSHTNFLYICKLNLAFTDYTIHFLTALHDTITFFSLENLTCTYSLHLEGYACPVLNIIHISFYYRISLDLLVVFDFCPTSYLNCLSQAFVSDEGRVKKI